MKRSTYDFGATYSDYKDMPKEFPWKRTAKAVGMFLLLTATFLIIFSWGGV